MMIEQFIGVICGIAERKVYCVRKKPSTDATKILGRSLRETRFVGFMKEIIQNRLPATSALRQKSVSGEKICPAERSFVVTILTPNIAYAVKHAACPSKVFLSFISILFERPDLLGCKSTNFLQLG